MKQLYLEYDETRSGGEICKGQEDDPWPSREPTLVTFRPKVLWRDEENCDSWIKESSLEF